MAALTTLGLESCATFKPEMSRRPFPFCGIALAWIVPGGKLFVSFEIVAIGFQLIVFILDRASDV